jgi:hypothetical protein
VKTPRIASVALVLALAACGGGGGGSDEEAIEPSGWALPPAESTDDDATTTTSTTTTPAESTTTTTAAPEADPACAAVTDLATPVRLDGDDDPDEVQPVYEAAAATLATDGPEILRPGATRLRELLPTAFQIVEDEDMSPEADAVIAEMVDVIDRLLTWSAGTCTVEDGTLVWACFSPQGFEVVGQSVEGDDPDAAATPEEVVADEGDLVEADRSDTEVLYAEVGPGGLVVRTELAVRSGDEGWIGGGSRDCDPETGGTFTPVGGPVG